MKTVTKFDNKPNRLAEVCPNCGFNLMDAVPNEGAGVTICSKCNAILKDERPKPDRLAELRAKYSVVIPMPGTCREWMELTNDSANDINELLGMVAAKDDELDTLRGEIEAECVLMSQHSIQCKAMNREKSEQIKELKAALEMRDAEVSPMSDLRLERLRHKFDASSDVHIRTTIDEFYNEVIRLRGELAGEKRTADIMSEGRVDAVRKLFTQVDELKAELEMRDGPELEELRVKLKEKNIQIEAMYEGMRSWSEKYNEAILKFGEQEAQIKELKDELAKCGVIAVDNVVLDDAKEPDEVTISRGPDDPLIDRLEAQARDTQESDKIRVEREVSIGDRIMVSGEPCIVTRVDDFSCWNEPEPVMSDERVKELSVEYKGGLSGIPVERGETGGFTSVSLGYTEDAVDAINECLTEIKRLKSG